METNLSSLLDQAVEKLPPFRRRVTKRYLENAKFRQSVLEDVAVSLHDHGPPEVKSFIESDNFDAHQTVGFDPATIVVIIDLIVKYLPSIIEIIRQIFKR